MWTLLRLVMKVGLGAPGRTVTGRLPLACQGTLLRAGTLFCSGGSCVMDMGRAGSWTAPTAGGVPLCCPLFSLDPQALGRADTGCWLPGPALPPLALLASSLRREAWPEALLALFLLLL